MPTSISELVIKWNSDGKASTTGEEFNVIYEKLLFLEETHYCQYVPTLGTGHHSYETRLERWLGNISAEQDQQLLLELAPQITFVGKEEFNKLNQVAFRGPIFRWLVERLRLPLDDPDLTAKVLLEANEHTWYCPITDSMPISDFSHVNHLGGIDMRPDWMSLARFGDEAKIKSYMAHPGSLKPGPLRQLVLLEDYVGSGTQMTDAVEFAVALNPAVGILLVPLIVSPAGAQKARNLATKYSNLSFEPVIELAPSDCINAATTFPDGSLEKGAVELATKTYSQVVGNNAASPRPYSCFGFLDTGAVVVLYSNTPANSLPLIQHQSNTWSALFPRSARIK